ncbi:nucleotidyltransferase domain-containing protein [Spirosoma luteum]|uniref:nucleotidyltransferase domain-containing protein n=1 Tax=Spirosoma luteum TaxID=431553 RepID=UPI00036866AA|nr:nucleotidyltransferase domain-containing protein [Spirosoma luteum]
MNITYDPKPLTNSQLQTLSRDVKQVLTELYGERLEQVVLYGSYARGDFHAESDVDYLVVLRDDVKAGKEVRRMAPVIGPLSLKYAVEVSIFPVAMEKYLLGYTPFYQAVQQEGTMV